MPARREQSTPGQGGGLASESLKRALLGSNPPRNSRLETHADGPGADRNELARATGRPPNRQLLTHRGRSPDLSKTHPGHSASVHQQLRYVTEYKAAVTISPAIRAAAFRPQPR
jgi:hypothetical protein